MENASKALIIAGAILVSILLISIGVIVINSTGNLQDQAKTSADTMAVQSFNANFTQYEGTNVTASNVKNLMSLIQASNASNNFSTAPANTNTDKYVYLDNSTGCVTSVSGVQIGHTYTVEITGYSTSGYVNKITIK